MTTQDLVTLEPLLRLGCFVGVFAVMALFEAWQPRRVLHLSRWVRWPSNLAIAALNTLLLRILAPTALVGLALAMEGADWGVAGVLPGWVGIIGAVLVLDLVVYGQHVMLHAVAPLWRLHRVHHADLDFDVTTGVRFHPLEILLSFAIKAVAVASLGLPAAGVVVFEVLLNASSLFNHTNLRIPPAVDRWLRLLVVTPDMHRVHHSVERRETNSNFGFNLPWWDRLFATYRAQPAAGHEAMEIGLAQFRDPSELRLDRLLTQPFRGGVGPYPIGRAGGVKAGSA